MVRLSLPHDSSKSLSCTHHDKERTPESWPRSVFSGAFEFLKSQTRMTGSCSRGTAVINLVGFSGSQATALTAFRPELLSVRLSFLVFISQTVTNPPLLPVT